MRCKLTVCFKACQVVDKNVSLFPSIGNQDEEYDEVTPTPDYDYSATLDYIFYSKKL